MFFVILSLPECIHGENAVKRDETRLCSYVIDACPVFLRRIANSLACPVRSSSEIAFSHAERLVGKKVKKVLLRYFP